MLGEEDEDEVGKKRWSFTLTGEKISVANRRLGIAKVGIWLTFLEQFDCGQIGGICTQR